MTTIQHKIQIGVNETTNEKVYIVEEFQVPNVSDTELQVFRSALHSNKQTNTLYKSVEDLVKRLYQIYTFKSVRSENTQEIWVKTNNVYKPIGKSIIYEFTRIMCGDQYKEHIANDVIAKVVADNFISSDLFFNTPYVPAIIVENGVLDLKTRELSTDCGDQIHFNKHPIKYDPEATCPNIDKFFGDILENETDIKTMYEIIGYCLYKDSFLEKAAMFLGTTRNGKSKTIDLINTFLGKENVSKLTLQRFEQDKSAVHMLQNKNANMSGDISGVPLKDVSRFKELCGRDEISTFRKFKDDARFKPFAKMIFATNNLPTLESDDSGFWTKWVFINFPYTFVDKELYESEKAKRDPEEQKYIKKQDPFIINKLITPEELSGLLNKALDGLDRVIKNESFTNNQSASTIQKIWGRNSNSLAAFIMDCIDTRYHSYISLEDFHTKYNEYCATIGKDPIRRGMSNTMNIYANSINVVRKFDSMNNERFWSNVKFKKEKDTKENNDKSMVLSIPYTQAEEEAIENANGHQDTLRSYKE